MGKGFNRQKNRKRDRRLGELQYDAHGKQVDDRDTVAGKNLGYKDIVRESPLFESFYRAQLICPEEEWDKMMEVLKSDLPAAFRITGTRSQAAGLQAIIEGTYFSELTAAQKEEGGGEVAVPSVLPWVPGGLAYQLNVTRKEIKKQPLYLRLHNFLIAETDVGAISRQETVSMLPPLVLDVLPHHKVLDMCAAPGSKTAQLIEALHEVPEGELPTGLLVANDADNARCYMLTHQAKRLQSPCFLIINHDASNLPNMFQSVPGSPDQVSHLKFDRILCDVPCTGDGTLRKNADIWPKWNPVNATNLHGIQYRIARRGLELLAVGGRMVYSTCSLHPVEDEAVMARILQECGDSVRLVEIAPKLPGLHYTRGLNTWRPASKEGELYSSWNEVPDKLAQTQIRPSMFPPAPEVAAGLGLDKCLRLLPHHNNTGGFFVALLEKVSLCPWEKAWASSNEVAISREDVEQEEIHPAKKVKYNNKGGLPPRARGFKEDPFTYFKPEDDEVYREIQEYFKLSLPSRGFLSRGKDESKKKNLYFTTEQVRDIVENNEERLKLINTGVKTFIKYEDKGSRCDYRLAQEGALSTVPYIKDRLVRLGREDMLVLLQNAEVDRPPEVASFSPPAQALLGALDTGSVAYVYKDLATGLAIELVGWLGKSSVRAYVAKTERQHYLRLLGVDTGLFETDKFAERKERGEGKAGKAEGKAEAGDTGVDGGETKLGGGEIKMEGAELKLDGGDIKTEGEVKTVGDVKTEAGINTEEVPTGLKANGVN